jgi:hypothetical protein
MEFKQKELFGVYDDFLFPAIARRVFFYLEPFSWVNSFILLHKSKKMPTIYKKLIRQVSVEISTDIPTMCMCIITNSIVLLIVVIISNG